MEPEFAKAFVAMQKELPVVPKAKRGQEGNQHYLYADLPSILEAAAPAMQKHGFAIMQKPSCVIGENGEVLAGVFTMLIHESGQCECVSTMIPVRKEHGTLTKAVGGVITYARRYALAILGICTDEDSESSPGVGSPPVPSKQVAAAGKREPRKTTSPAMKKTNREKLKFAVRERIKELGDESIGEGEVLAAVAKGLGYSSPIEMKDSDYERALSAAQEFEPGEAVG